MDVFECIRSQRATRWFRPEPIAEEQLLRILDAGRRAGSAKNRQSWQFVVVRDPAMLAGLSEGGRYAEHLRRAAAAIVIVMEPGPALITLFDAGRAAQNIMLAAQAEGIGSCVATLTEFDLVRTLLGIPEAPVIASAISLGYPAEETAEQRAQITQVLAQRGRKPLPELVRWERW